MKIEDVQNVAVLGAGVMGNSIALVFARKGYNVRLWSRTQKTIDRAVGLIKSTLTLMSEYGHVSDAEIPRIIERILPTTDLTLAAEGAHFALETVAENPDVKKDIFSKLNKSCSKDTIFSSNTSGLDIFTILDVDNPGRLITTHWFSPATLIPLVEVAPGKETSPETITLTIDILKGLGKRPILLKEFVPAFIVNRFQDSINKTTFEIIDKGWATPEDIDTAIKNTLGIRLPVVGVAQVLDFNGLDLIDSILKRRGVNSKFIEDKVKQGHLGAKTSKGIYDYGDRTEAELLDKRDRQFYKMLEHLEKINAFEPL